jgi:hypothetical protein
MSQFMVAGVPHKAVQIPEELHDRLKACSRATGTKIGKLAIEAIQIRTAIDQDTMKQLNDASTDEDPIGEHVAIALEDYLESEQ